MPVRQTAAIVTSAFVSLLATCTAAVAAPAVDGHFPIPKSDENNDKLAAGPDGNMWVVIHEGENDVAKVKPDGSFEEFELEGIEGASGIALGPEGRMWVTQINKVASFDVSNPKASTKATTIATVTANNPIVAGPDGQMWVAATENVVHFSPADPTKNGAFNVPKLAPKDIDVAGSLLAIADQNNSRIVTITIAGEIKEIPLTGENGTSQGVAGSPAGQIAFSEQSQPEGLGLVTPPNPPSILQMQGDPFGVARGSDEAYYFAMSAADNVQRLTPDGKNAPIGGFPPKFFPRQIAAGPNNTIWVTMEIPGEEVDEIARISGLEPPAKPTSTNTPKPVRPETKIDKGPKKKVKTKGKRASVKFRFSSTTPGATFECALVRKAKKGKKTPKPKFKSCKSPKKLKLRPGRYRFSVRAVSGGLVDPTPATRSFRVIHVR
jgi:sugar lactone lactonase YvrE